MRTILALAAALLPAVAHADALIDNVNGETLDRDGRVVRFKAMVIDAQGKVVRLVAPERATAQADAQEPRPALRLARRHEGTHDDPRLRRRARATSWNWASRRWSST